MREIQYDERSGCVAVYYGKPRNCLDGIHYTRECIFYRHGTYNKEAGHWEMNQDDLNEARKVYDKACEAEENK